VRQKARVRLDDVLERGPVDLHGIADVGPGQRPGEDHGTHHEVVGERDLRLHAL
jgi:hypothetical protein